MSDSHANYLGRGALWIDSSYWPRAWEACFLRLDFANVVSVAIVSEPISYSVQSLAALPTTHDSVSRACLHHLYNSIVVKTASKDGTYFHSLLVCSRGDATTWLSFVHRERLISQVTPCSS